MSKETTDLLNVGDYITGIGHYSNEPESIRKVKRVTAKTAYIGEKPREIGYVRKVRESGNINPRAARGAWSTGPAYRRAVKADWGIIAERKAHSQRLAWYKDFKPTPSQLKEIHGKYGAILESLKNQETAVK